MSMLDQLDDEKRQSIAVFASSPACAGAIRDYVAGNPELHLRLALLEDACGLSPHRHPTQTFMEVVLGPNIWAPETRWPGNVRVAYSSLEIDPALLVSVSGLVWFVDKAKLIPPTPDTGWWSCVLNVALGLGYGLPLECRDEKGQAVPSPLTGSMAAFAQDELARWHAKRQAFTVEIATEGMVFSPDICEPALWSRDGGAIDAGGMDLSLGLIWRIRRLEHWIDLHEPGEAWPADEAIAIEAEERACVEELHAELGSDVTIKTYWGNA